MLGGGVSHHPDHPDEQDRRATEAEDNAARSLPRLVRAIRAKASLSIPDFAAELDVSPRTVSCWESGDLLPRPPHLEALCRMARADAIVFHESSGWSLDFSEQVLDTHGGGSVEGSTC